VFVKYIIYQMNSGSQESAITEAIAFILTFAMIMSVLSLYVVYVVPAEGRENKIRHMNTIKKMFLSTTKFLLIHSGIIKTGTYA